MLNPKEDKFLSDLAAATGRSRQALLAAGYDESIPGYLAAGKTVAQVAGGIRSAERFSQRGLVGANPSVP